MSRSSEQKIRMLVLYDILRKESDEDSPLSTNELIEKLSQYGIAATRQTVYDDIEMLNTFGYEIICDHGRNNRYFVSDRRVELPEVQILLYAVGASKFLTEKKATVLTEKIAELLGNIQANRVKELLAKKDGESGNELIYYSINEITTALIEKRKLSFLYFDFGSRGERVYRKDKERYKVNPLGMVYSGECFYLVCFHDKYGNPASYRIDKMTDVRVEEEPITQKKEYEKFDLSAYKRETFGNILTNERYCGDMILQKTFTENCITKKVKKNRGEKTKYLIANNHTPIVSSEMFKKVQREMARRRGKRQTSDKSLTALGKYSGKFALSELLVCGDCGSPYKRITWVKNGVSRKVWRCLSKVDHGKKFCAKSPALDEKKLHAAICRGLTKLLENKDEVLDMIISNLSSVITGDDDVLDTGAIENQIHYLKDEVNANVQLLITTEGDKQKYVDVISQLNDKIAVLNKQLEAEREKIAANPNLKMQIEDIKETLSNTELCFSEYDDVMIRRLVGLIRVMKDKSIVIFLKGGLNITEMVA